MGFHSVLTEIQIKAFVGLVVGLWLIITLAGGQPLPGHLLSSFSYAVTGTSFTLLLWDRWLWRNRIFRGWLTKRPDLGGTWKGTLLSSWPDPETGQRTGPIEVYLVIRQTFSSISARMFSVEMNSVSLSAAIVSERSGTHTLFITYRSEPRVLLREVSPIHYGGMLLNVRGTPVQRLDGGYWTDRLTKGEAEFLARARGMSDDFGTAAVCFAHDTTT
ncbi:MAG TPA: hypothetical protein VLY23_01605 [Candidatus Acidoferrum sp.]|nr:hypothetical protein [Candidatus Acidoferrum sp.]